MGGWAGAEGKEHDRSQRCANQKECGLAGSLRSAGKKAVSLLAMLRGAEVPIHVRAPRRAAATNLLVRRVTKQTASDGSEWRLESPTCRIARRRNARVSTDKWQSRSHRPAAC